MPAVVPNEPADSAPPVVVMIGTPDVEPTVTLTYCHDGAPAPFDVSTWPPVPLAPAINKGPDVKFTPPDPFGVRLMSIFVADPVADMVGDDALTAFVIVRLLTPDFTDCNVRMLLLVVVEN